MRALRARRPGQLFGLLRKTMGATTQAFGRSLCRPRRCRSVAPAAAAFYDQNQDTRRCAWVNSSLDLALLRMWRGANDASAIAGVETTSSSPEAIAFTIASKSWDCLTGLVR